MRKFLKLSNILTAITVLICSAVWLSACEDDAKVASRNLSKAADMFEINRRVVFLNGITDGYILEIEGRCSIKDQGDQLEVTCKNGPNSYKKHFLGLSDNVTYFAEQIHDVDVSVFHYRVTFKPQTILPDIDARGSLSEAVDRVNPLATDTEEVKPQ